MVFWKQPSEKQKPLQKYTAKVSGTAKKNRRYLLAIL